MQNETLERTKKVGTTVEPQATSLTENVVRTSTDLD